MLTEPEDEDLQPPAVMEDHDGGEASEMTLWEHLEELRWVILKSGVAFVIAGALIGIGLLNFKAALDWPLDRAEAMAQVEGGVDIRTREVTEIFSVIFQLLFFGSLGMSLPFALYFLARFIAPGLTKEERQLLRPVCLALLALFFAGCALSYFFVLPMMFFVSIKLNAFMGFTEMWSPGSYYGSVVSITLALGLIFQFPVVLVALVHLGILEVDTLRRGRRYAFLILVIFSAFVTPTGDPVTLFMVAVPLYGLYEGAIAVGQRLLSRNPMNDY
ncbi:MAG: twin-arginine translocase subunit TatC [Opitutales bacterium]